MNAATAAEEFNNSAVEALPGHLGIVAEELRHGYGRMILPVAPHLMATNGYLHAGSVVTLADTCAGVACMHSFPPGAENFTTVELKSNFLGTCREGHIEAVATMIHGGRSTQVWDCTVRDAGRDKLIALFRCTQMLLYPR